MPAFLIVDEPQALEGYLKDFQLETGAQIFTASTREQALPYLDRKELSAIILDFTVNLPDRSSFYFEIVTIPTLMHVPCLVLADRRTVKDVEKLLHRPQDRVILKPVTGAILSRETALLLNLPRRVSLELMVRVYPEGSDSPFPLRGKTINISSNGMLLRLGGPLPLKARVRIELIMENEPFVLFGIVRREERLYNEYAYGIELQAIAKGNPKRFFELYGVELTLPANQASSGTI
jgi:DNA-binding response OmpR family regulator